MKNKSLMVFVILVLCLLSVSVVSAGFWSSLLQFFSGKSGKAIGNYECVIYNTNGVA